MQIEYKNYARVIRIGEYFMDALHKKCQLEDSWISEGICKILKYKFVQDVHEIHPYP